MTAKEMRKMVSEMRDHRCEIKSRMDLENYAYYLYHGLKAIGRTELATEMWKLYGEFEEVDTEEIMKEKIFN